MIKFVTVLFCIILIFNSLHCFAHRKALYSTIVDTDCGLDDLRALCLLLADPNVKINAITTCDGVLSPSVGIAKVNSLLQSFGHIGILTGCGTENINNNPPFRKINQEIKWTDNQIITNSYNKAIEIIKRCVIRDKKKLILICLGPLTNISNTLKEFPDIKQNIDRIIWYNGSINPLKGFNYEADKNAADFVFKQNINIQVITAGATPISLSSELITLIGAIESEYAKSIYTTHNQDIVINLLKQKHLKLWDDLVPLFLTNPQHFYQTDSITSCNLRSYSIKNPQNLEILITATLDSDKQDKGVIFNYIPETKEWYQPDINDSIDIIISNHGRKEWRAIALTNEFHEHLGIYSIIGAKMGIKARDIFNVGIDELIITSYSGNKPPLSCLTDGLQTSTGGTLGHGTITISDDRNLRPEATFFFIDIICSIKLKDKYIQTVKSEIDKGIKLYGNLTPAYWLYVRKLGMQIWKDWNRDEIFEIKIKNNE